MWQSPCGLAGCRVLGLCCDQGSQLSLTGRYPNQALKSSLGKAIYTPPALLSGEIFTLDATDPQEILIEILLF